jgi:hypothetical protein
LQLVLPPAWQAWGTYAQPVVAMPWPLMNSLWLNSMKLPVGSAALLRALSGPYRCCSMAPARSKPQLLM